MRRTCMFLNVSAGPTCTKQNSGLHVQQALYAQSDCCMNKIAGSACSMTTLNSDMSHCMAPAATEYMLCVCSDELKQQGQQMLRQEDEVLPGTQCRTPQQF